MKNVTGLRLFIVAAFIAAMIAGYLKQPVLSVLLLGLMAVAGIAGFKWVVAERAENAIKGGGFNKFPGSLLKEGASGLVIYLVFLLMMYFLGWVVLNALLKHDLLYNWPIPVVLALISVALQYYGYRQYLEKTKN